MKSIRFGTFETNSSSCHSISVTTTPRRISEFNEGKRWYYAGNCRYGSSDNSGFYTLEELFEIIKGYIEQDNLESYKFEEISSNFGTPYITDLGGWSYDQSYKSDTDRIKAFFIKHFSMELMRFALTDEENEKFISKYLFHSIVNGILYSYGLTPAISKDELLNTCIRFNTSEYESNASGCWGPAKEDPQGIYTYEESGKEENFDKLFTFIADIRD